MTQRILYIYPALSTFIRKDLDFLTEDYEVMVDDNEWEQKRLTPYYMLRQFFFLCRNLRKSSAIFVMFGGYWAVLPALMGRWFGVPVFIILGGTDCVSYPSINYGNLRIPVLKFFLKFAYQYATELLPVHETLIKFKNNYYLEAEAEQGIVYHFKSLKPRYTVVYNGFIPESFKYVDGVKKVKGSFVSLAAIDGQMRYILKGGDLILSLAKALPECSFTIIGVTADFVATLGLIPSNLKLIGFTKTEELASILSASEFYLQLSISEGFPNALCEGMLCKCVPIGSGVGAIPFIIDDCGFIVHKRDEQLLLAQVRQILQYDKASLESMAEKARNRIVDKFPISKRKDMFDALIQKYAPHPKLT